MTFEVDLRGETTSSECPSLECTSMTTDSGNVLLCQRGFSMLRCTAVTLLGNDTVTRPSLAVWSDEMNHITIFLSHPPASLFEDL